MLSYLTTCLWLILPPLLWNALLARFLPPAFQPAALDRGVPGWLLATESALRVPVFLFPIIMAFSLDQPVQRIGLVLYLLGLALYFASWVWVIRAPDGAWAASLPGTLAPALTPLIWLIGIGLIGQQVLLPLPHAGVIYLTLAIAFVAVHAAHSWLAYHAR